METIITIEDKGLRDKVQELLDINNYVVSLTAPTFQSPYPLWIYNNTIKMWVGTKWVNVGECNITPTSDFRLSENGILRRIN